MTSSAFAFLSGRSGSTGSLLDGNRLDDRRSFSANGERTFPVGDRAPKQAIHPRAIEGFRTIKRQKSNLVSATMKQLLRVAEMSAVDEAHRDLPGHDHQRDDGIRRAVGRA